MSKIQINVSLIEKYNLTSTGVLAYAGIVATYNPFRSIPVRSGDIAKALFGPTSTKEQTIKTGIKELVRRGVLQISHEKPLLYDTRTLYEKGEKMAEIDTDVFQRLTDTSVKMSPLLKLYIILSCEIDQSEDGVANISLEALAQANTCEPSVLFSRLMRISQTGLIFYKDCSSYPSVQRGEYNELFVSKIAQTSVLLNKVDKIYQEDLLIGELNDNR